MSMDTNLHHADPGAEPPPGGELLSLLSLSVGGEVLAVPINEVREILEFGHLTPMPRTPAFISGMMNLRGAVVPVIDLRRRLRGVATAVGPRSCIVVVEGRDLAARNDADPQADDDETASAPLTLGMLVDGVHEVFDVDAGEVEPVPALGTSVDPRFLAGMARVRGQVTPLLALPRVFAPAELGALIAQHQAH